MYPTRTNIWLLVLPSLLLLDSSTSANHVAASTNAFAPAVRPTPANQLTRTKSVMGDTTEQASTELVRNFRQASGISRIYRCASTDDLATLFDADIGRNAATTSAIKCGASDKHSPEHVLLYRSGLILDLRSPSERNEKKARRWMANAPGGKMDAKEFDGAMTLGIGTEEKKRTVFRIDVLSPSRLFGHLTDNWLSPAQRALATMYYAIDGNKLHELRMNVLNDRGLPGLYEAIVQTSGRELCAALRSLTEYFEAIGRRGNTEGAAVVHCVQGKDRTGLVIMLCQSIIGLSDEEIIADYFLSDKMGKSDEGSAAANQFGGKVVRKGKLDRRVFSGAPREAMKITLELLRREYGSVSPGYLDTIGFDEQWRRRFISAVAGEEGSDDLPKSKL